MKGTRFLSYVRTTALGGFAVSALCGLAFTLSSCSGGGEEEGSFIVTANQFRAGKGFVIRAGDAWSLQATSPTGNILPPTEENLGAVECNGQILYGLDGTQGESGLAYIIVTYRYDEAHKRGYAEWSWVSAEDEKPSEALGAIVSPHKLSGAGDEANNNNGNGNNDATWGGTGTAEDPSMQAPHIGPMKIVFDFETGKCQLTCGCGHPDGWIPFSVSQN